MLGREQGDPKQLLKCINPREADLMDAAAGVHVRLRLGGETFPPMIYYKIFTRRPVADVCSFGPRNYSQELRPYGEPKKITITKLAPRQDNQTPSWVNCRLFCAASTFSLEV